MVVPFCVDSAVSCRVQEQSLARSSLFAWRTGIDANHLHPCRHSFDVAAKQHNKLLALRHLPTHPYESIRACRHQTLHLRQSWRSLIGLETHSVVL